MTGSAGKSANGWAAPGSARKRSGGVVGAVEELLKDRDLGPIDEVRAAVMRNLAAELDDPSAPRYGKSRNAAALRALLTELEEGPAGRHVDIPLRELLRDAVRA